MENEKLDIQVGDKITYKHKAMEVENTEIVYELGRISTLLFEIKEGNMEILKIERPKYEVVEEKKELLTDEEKEFLKDICKYYDVTEIRLNNIEIKIINNNHIISCFNYPDNMEFENLERGKRYTLEDLGLEEN